MGRFLFFCLFLPGLVFGQPRVGIIDFFGLGKVSEEKIRKVLQVQVGDPLPRSKGDVELALEQVPGVVHARLEAVCCADGKAILYVGIEERGAPHFDYRNPPEGEVELPEEVSEAYGRFLGALAEAARQGQTAEDLTQGHSLMANPECRRIQQRFLVFAELHLDRLREALRNAADEDQRAMAAYLIGYAKRKHDVIDDLQYALRDPSDRVRTNAMRSLSAIRVLAGLQPDLGLKIPATWFVEMMNSLVWSDRHDAAKHLIDLTEKRDPGVLGHLRDRALEAVVDMARWQHLPHALPGYILLGRIGGMPEQAIQESWSRGQREQTIERILKDLKASRK